MESGYFGVYNNYIKIVIIIDIPITIKFNSCVEVIMHFRTATAMHDNYLSLSRHSCQILMENCCFTNIVI